MTAPAAFPLGEQTIKCSSQLPRLGYKTELIRRRGPWKGIDDVEYATLEWVDWFTS